ncbi:NAD(P)/FAD-dependent oxidoreductase [Henriciella sp.]|uniref:NAD(P)/FAD-dependent oxidoreductase n=1 Tax=Henriciella sp. TaxID=1968823 RepID=UPI00260D202B|nr:NAD(P)/FAD-dependent oxidoreductase [Henriciella sp.]
MSMDCDVAIIGAGPAGAVAASLLVEKGWSVRVVERQHFPRFSIGESLLPHCVEFMENAGLLEAVEAQGFQYKDGAAFFMNGRYEPISFPEKSTPGPGTVFQVRRDIFDDVLICKAKERGADVTFGTSVKAFAEKAEGVILTVEDEEEAESEVRASFVLDASGFGRVLPRLLDLEEPSGQERRRSCFKHVIDNITHPGFDRNKILISVDPIDPQVWLWLIPLADGRASIGVVGRDEVISRAGETADERLMYFTRRSGFMADVLKDATEARPAAETVGYSCSVKALTGKRFVLLGNAAEFLDPVFSSGITIAMKSATLAAGLVDRELRGEIVDWDSEFAGELSVGVNVFRACVNAWYEGLLQHMIFMETRGHDITKHFTAILAGYAWDRNNPIVRDPQRFFRLMDSMTRA